MSLHQHSLGPWVQLPPYQLFGLWPGQESVHRCSITCHVQMPMPRIWDRRGSCTFPACDLSNDSKFLGKTHNSCDSLHALGIFLRKTQVLAHHLADRPNHWPWEVYESRNETQTGDDDDMEKIGKIEATLASTHSVKENWRGSAQCLVARHSTCRNGWVL